MTTHAEAIRLAMEADILFQSNIGITGRENISTEGSQPIKRIERLIQLAKNEAFKEAAQLAKDSTAYVQFQSKAHYAQAALIEAAILDLVKE